MGHNIFPLIHPQTILIGVPYTLLDPFLMCAWGYVWISGDLHVCSYSDLSLSCTGSDKEEETKYNQRSSQYKGRLTYGQLHVKKTCNKTHTHPLGIAQAYANNDLQCTDIVNVSVSVDPIHIHANIYRPVQHTH